MKAWRPAWFVATALWLGLGACRDEPASKPPVTPATTPAHSQHAEPTETAHAEHHHEQEHEHDHGHDHAAMAPGKALEDQSLYHLDAQLTSQHGKAHPLGELRGSVVVLAMVYTHCEYACPRIVADLQRIEGQLTADERKATTFVLVSIDPERDTVERLRTFAEEAGLTGPGWRLLRGSDDDVRTVAAALGVKYRRTTPSDFAHSNLIHVLDREGVIVNQQEGLGAKADATVAAIRTALGPQALERH